MNWKMKCDIQITSIEIWKKSQFLFYYISVEKISYYIYCISVSVLSVSVSADMKNAISVFYRYRPIRKLSLSGFIGIGRYEKRLIGRTLTIQHTSSLCHIHIHLWIVYILHWEELRIQSSCKMVDILDYKKKLFKTIYICIHSNIFEMNIISRNF